MTDVPARSALAQLCMDAAAPIDVSSEPFYFVSSGIRKRNTHAYSTGITGSRSRRSHRARIVQTYVGGPLILEPSPTEIDLMLPRILGGTTGGGVTDVADTLPEFLIAIDKVTKVMTYSGCRVARAVIQGSQNQAMRWSLDIEAETQSTGNAGTFPALTLPTDNFFVFSDLTLTLESVSRKFRDFTLTIDNLLDADRWHNSLTRAEIAAQDRLVQLSVNLPYTSDNEDLFDAAIAGAAGQLVMTDGTTTYTIDIANAKVPTEGPEVPGRGQEIRMPLVVDCFHDGTDSECKWTKS